MNPGLLASTLRQDLSLLVWPVLRSVQKKDLRGYKINTAGTETARGHKPGPQFASQSVQGLV
jgi:hypothetical protein